MTRPRQKRYRLSKGLPACLLALTTCLPALYPLGAEAMPLASPVSPALSRQLPLAAPDPDVVEVNIIDQFLRDAGAGRRSHAARHRAPRKSPGTARSTAKPGAASQAKPAVPVPVAPGQPSDSQQPGTAPDVANIPVPLPRPANGPDDGAAQTGDQKDANRSPAPDASDAKQAAGGAGNGASMTQDGGQRVEKAGPLPPATDDTAPGPASSAVTANEKPAAAKTPGAGDTGNGQKSKAADSSTGTDSKDGDGKAAASDSANGAGTAPTPPPPVVQQPATAAEPAHETPVPTPLAKPGDAPDGDVTNGGAGKTTAAGTAPGTPAAGADGTPSDGNKPEGAASDGKTDQAEVSPPPPPIVHEDPDELKACLADLTAIGAKFTPTDPIDDGDGCGIEHPIDLDEVVPGVATGGATMRCKTALALAHWMKGTVQPAMSVAMPDRHIKSIVPGSTYACRLRNSATTGKISEHAHGNAYDVAAFKLDNGETMQMTSKTDVHTMTGAFQHAVTAGACLYFTTVLSPGSDAAHETHMHLDVMDRKGQYRICE